MDISDDLWPGRPHISDGIRAFRTRFRRTRDVQRDIADITGLSLGNVHDILTTQIEMNKVCAPWVLRMLTSDERNERHEVSITLLNRGRQNEFPKCSVRLYHTNFICIL